MAGAETQSRCSVLLRDAGLPLLAGVAYAAAHTTLAAWFPLPFLTFVPVLVALRLSPRPWVAATIYGLVFGGIMLFGTQSYGWAFYGISILAIGGAHVLPMLVYAWLVRHRSSETVIVAAFACAYVLFEFVMSLQRVLPIGHVSGVLAAEPVWLQILPVAGPFTASWLVAGVNAAVVGAGWSIARRSARPAAVLLGSSVAVLACWFAYGRSTLESDVVDDRLLDVAVVQGALTKAQYTAGESDGDAASLVVERYLEMSRDVVAPGTLLIWPENAVRRFAGFGPELDELLGSGGRLLGGFPLRQPGRGMSEITTNSVMYFNGSSRVRAHYSKNHLVPISEAGFTSLGEVGLVRTETESFATPICFEAALAGYMHSLLELDPDALIVVSNDAGFGRYSPVSAYMLKQSVLAAAAARKFMVRAGQSGISAVVDGHGRILVHTTMFERTVLRSQIGLRSGLTPYVRSGDYCALVSMVLLPLLLRRPRRHHRLEVFGTRPAVDVRHRASPSGRASHPISASHSG